MNSDALLVLLSAAIRGELLREMHGDPAMVSTVAGELMARGWIGAFSIGRSDRECPRRGSVQFSMQITRSGVRAIAAFQARLGAAT